MNFLKQTFENNIWKFFVYQLSQRRNFIPILSIYFLTLPSTNAQQIGMYTWIWFLASFLLQIPTWFFSDHFWHKSSLIISKILMVLSTITFIYGGNFYYFIIWSVLMSISTAFDSWAKSAFLHETLAKLDNKEHLFSKIKWKIDANISFISIFFIVGLPFLTKIDMLLPFKIGLVIDIIWLFVAFLFCSTNNSIEKHEKKSFFTLVKESKSIWFFPIAIFTSAITGFLFADSAFRSVYLESLWYPIILIGAVMGFSRFVRFIVWHFSYILKEKFTLKQQLFFEIVVFTTYYILVSFISNPYMVWIIFSIVIWYMWWRGSVIEDYVLTHYTKDKKYKATILSIKSQISAIFQFTLSFFIWFIMNISYELWFMVLGFILFVVLVTSYNFIKVEN